jgi:hypothetical protein
LASLFAWTAVVLLAPALASALSCEATAPLESELAWLLLLAGVGLLAFPSS